MVTAYELFEHFDKPLVEIENLLKYSKTILFSTLIYDKDMEYKDFSSWWYYVPQIGQHIMFYSKKTLNIIASKFNLNYYEINEGLHLFTDKALNENKLKLYTKSKMGKVFRYYDWIVNKRYGKAMEDMVYMQSNRRLK